MADSYSYLKEIGSKRSEIKLKSNSPIHRIMEKWSKTAVNTMKKNTPKASGALAASISFKFGNEDGIITVDFLADDYWDYVNSGVDGFIQSSGAIENKFGGTYSFKSEVPSRKMVDAFIGEGKRNWMASKGITSLSNSRSHSALVNLKPGIAAVRLPKHTVQWPAEEGSL